jgi:hypothetical protein
MLKIKLTPRQYKAIQYLTDKTTRAILYGGSKGGGKSFILCHWVHFWCNELCSILQLEPSTAPIPLGFIGRKQSIDFRKTTLETWKRSIPSENYTIKEHTGEIILFNGSCKVFFGGLDSQDTINKFNSAEFSFFAIDQAEETTREDVAVLRGALRLKVNGIQPVYKELYTANPSDCWLKEDFVDHKLPKHVYIPALPSDNPHLPDNYIETLEAAFKHSQPLLRAYRDGDWSALKSTNTLLSSDDIKKLEGITIHYPKDKRVIICDPATTHDECVIYCLHNYEIIDQNILTGETDEMKIAGQMAVMSKKHNCLDLGGDSIGLGSGIFARLQEMGEYRVHRINSSESSFSKSFTNKRAEIYWNLMRKIIDKQIPYIKDEELRRQLINTTYEVIGSNGEIKITMKDKIKKVLGRSPDRADAFAMGVWLSDQVEAFHVKPKSRTIYFETSNDDVMDTVV